MKNLVVFFDKNKDILRIVSKYREFYHADVIQIETIERIGFLDRLNNRNLNIKRINLNLNNYQNIILVSSLWKNQIPTPVIKFLEQNTGKINNIIYVLYNKNKADKPQEFDKMDKILNLRRDKSYFINLDKKDIHIRVYQ